MGILVDQAQTGLSVLQAVPIVGPLVFSPVKIIVSTAQMVGGLALGIIFGIGATVADAVGARSLRDTLGEVAVHSFGHAIKGFGSLFYACVNLASLGIIGGCIELSKRDVQYFGNEHRSNSAERRLNHSWDQVRRMGRGW